MYEAEALTVTAEGVWAVNEARNTTDKDCSGGKFYFVQTNNEGSIGWDQVKNNRVSFAFGDVEAGTYRVYARTKDNVDRGIYQFSVDTTALGGPVDMYQPESDYTAAYGSYVEHDLGILEHGGGPLTIVAGLVGQNDAASNRYGMALDCFRLVKDGEPTDPTEPEGTYRMTLDSEGVSMSDGWQPSGLTGSAAEARSVYSETAGEYVEFKPAGLEGGLV